MSHWCFLFQDACLVKEESESVSHSVLPNFLWPHGLYSLPGFSVHGSFQDKNTGVGCHSLLQGSSQSRDQILVSCTADRFFTIWGTREAPEYIFAEILLKHFYSPGWFMAYKCLSTFVGSVMLYKDLSHFSWFLNTVNSFMSFPQFQFISGTCNKSISYVYDYIQF